MLAAVVAMVALAGGVGGGDITDRPLDWALAGVAAGGRALVVQPGIYGGCDRGTPQVAVRERRSSIDVSVTVTSVRGPEVVCPAIARYAPAQRVRLARPVAGRPVGGDLEAHAPGFVLDARLPASARTRVPRVVGLAFGDARQVLCAWRLRAARNGPRPRGRVVAQRPRPGTAYRVPSGAAPKDCGALADRPVVRLTVR
jgi:hypothetical protein